MSVMAWRGFHLTQTPAKAVEAQFDSGGWLHIAQGDQIIVISPAAVSIFQRAVADLKVIP
jgi:hypothetical protein